MEIKAVIFDMDGVITDSERFAKETMKQSYLINKLPFDEKMYVKTIGATRAFTFDMMRSICDDKATIEKTLDDYKAIMAYNFATGKIGFKKGAMEIINYLNEHHFPICLASSADMVKIQRSFNSNHVEMPFKNIVCGNDITKSKPDPQIFLKAAEKMGVDIKNCLVVEDSYQGVQAGYSAGATVIMVPDLLPPNENCLKQAKFIKKDLCEVLEFVKPYVNP